MFILFPHTCRYWHLFCFSVRLIIRNPRTAPSISDLIVRAALKLMSMTVYRSSLVSDTHVIANFPSWLPATLPSTDYDLITTTIFSIATPGKSRVFVKIPHDYSFWLYVPQISKKGNKVLFLFRPHHQQDLLSPKILHQSTCSPSTETSRPPPIIFKILGKEKLIMPIMPEAPQKSGFPLLHLEITPKLTLQHWAKHEDNNFKSKTIFSDYVRVLCQKVHKKVSSLCCIWKPTQINLLCWKNLVKIH